MTHYATLSGAVTRKAESGGPTLTFRNSDTSVRELIEHLAEGGEIDSFLASHSSVKGYHARVVRDIWYSIRPETAAHTEAWRQLRQQADWARVSEVISARIEREPVALSDPPTRDQYLSLVREVADELGIGSEATSSPEAFAKPAGSHKQNASGCPETPNVSKRATDQLTDAAIRLERAVALLSRASHPALSSYTRLLVNRIDEIVDEVRNRPRAD